ncbi:MAG: FprA family A-type flavoprotein [Thermoplasmatota archaeon]
MTGVELKPGIFWVGAVDWDIRNFHGYSTNRGTTYNAYLIIDEKVVLIDTVKRHLFEEMLARISAIVEPSKIDYVVANHVEMDHSGSLPMVLGLAPGARVLCSPQGEKGLSRHYRQRWDLRVVRTGERVATGRRSLVFHLMPMVHWPDSMATYVPEERLLLPNDAFGQHIASTERFDDELDWGVLREEAAKYYANIVLPYSEQVGGALAALSGLKVDMIAPSHGIIWRRGVGDILAEYSRWSSHRTDARAVIVYDTMWGSTEMLARALRLGLEDAGVPARMRPLKANHISDVMTDVLTSRVVLVGSPTLNNGLMPTVAAFLTYMKGLRPRRRVGMAFGSYGWGGQAPGEIEGVMKGLGWEVPEPAINIKWVPDEGELASAREAARRLGAGLGGVA